MSDCICAIWLDMYSISWSNVSMPGGNMCPHLFMKSLMSGSSPCSFCFTSSLRSRTISDICARSACVRFWRLSCIPWKYCWMELLLQLLHERVEVLAGAAVHEVVVAQLLDAPAGAFGQRVQLVEVTVRHLPQHVR